jgi:hypothetical protein
MIRPVVCVLGFAFAAAIVGMFAPAAQTEDVLDACEPGKREIKAAALPGIVEPGECPIEGRRIVDGGVGTVVPGPGEGVYAEILTTSGAQELEVRRRADGALELEHVGDDSDAAATEGSAGLTGGPGECSDPAYTHFSYRVASSLDYRINLTSTPPEISRRSAKNAIRRAASNVFGTDNDCRMGDRVPVALRYAGKTPARAQSGNGLCGADDGRSVVSFGSLREGVLAAACTLSNERPGYNEVRVSDVKINKANFKWTTKPGSRSCSKRFDVESVMTHEWGHTFGLGHVLESRHGNLTMSGGVNGPCQDAERTLGRGDVLALDGKYR